jgi:hypothetical protein
LRAVYKSVRKFNSNWKIKGVPKAVQSHGLFLFKSYPFDHWGLREDATQKNMPEIRKLRHPCRNARCDE